MGRNTFEKALSFSAWPYQGKRVVVLTRRALDIPAALTKAVAASAEAPRELVTRLSAQGASHLYVDGGITIQRFLAAGLIDEITITRIPVLLGAGIPLFGPTGGDIPLRHLATRAYDNGYVQSKYRVIRDR
jgi:dihydrofolate reductase